MQVMFIQAVDEPTNVVQTLTKTPLQFHHNTPKADNLRDVVRKPSKSGYRLVRQNEGIGEGPPRPTHEISCLTGPDA
jgi:hypothetical protein